MVQPPPSEFQTQKAVLLAMLFVVGMYGWVIRSWLKGPESLEEKDVALALQEKRRREAELAAALGERRDTLSHRLMVLYRTGEWKRKTKAA